MRRVDGLAHRGARRAASLHLAHEKAALRAHLNQALGLQVVVSGHHGGRADALLLCALAHAGQARASGQKVVADPAGKAGGQLFGQGLAQGIGVAHGVNRLCGVYGVCRQIFG